MIILELLFYRVHQNIKRRTPPYDTSLVETPLFDRHKLHHRVNFSGTTSNKPHDHANFSSSVHDFLSTFYVMSSTSSVINTKTLRIHLDKYYSLLTNQSTNLLKYR